MNKWFRGFSANQKSGRTSFRETANQNILKSSVERDQKSLIWYQRSEYKSYLALVSRLFEIHIIEFID